MFKFLIWNVRGIGTLSIRNKVCGICRIHNIFLAISEPHMLHDEIQTTSHMIGFDNYLINSNNKIWIF